MSLRRRLSLLYTTFIAGILLIFGAMVYLLVNAILLNQVDDMLESLANEIVGISTVTPTGEITLISFPELNMTASTYVQIWGKDGTLITRSPTADKFLHALDPARLKSTEPIFTDLYFNNQHLRVLTVPLETKQRHVATLQVGTSLEMLDMTASRLVSIIAIIGLGAVLIAWYGSRMAVGLALSPLEDIAETLNQINRADDLSRRIPYQGTMGDEIGDLVTSVNQTLERLESLFTSQQRFLADVSHELRTPLTVIKGSVDLMRRFKKADEDSLNSIDQEAGRLTRLVGGLLMLAQAEAGKLPLVFKPVELDLLLTEVFTEMRVLAGSKVQVHLNDIDQVIVNGDRDRLKQVLLNLVANAIQYTPPDGEIFLSLSRIGDQGRLIVRDTGPGIPAEDLPHIFDRFYRAEKSRTRSKVSGFGLGLSIAHWIIEQHGGEIKVESKQGEGTTFVIWLNVVK